MSSTKPKNAPTEFEAFVKANPGLSDAEIKKAFWQGANPRAVWEALEEANPDASDAKLRKLFWQACRRDRALMRAIHYEWFNQVYHEITGKPWLN
jgi:hypothetical protein